MRHRIVLVVLVAAGVIAASGTAFAVANSVSTTPPPAFISHLDKSIVDHPDPTTTTIPRVTTPTTTTATTRRPRRQSQGASTSWTAVCGRPDGHRGANRGHDGPDDSADDHRGPSAQSGPGSTQAPSTTVAGGATTTDDDDEASTTSVTTGPRSMTTTRRRPRRFDDHGDDGKAGSPTTVDDHGHERQTVAGPAGLVVRLGRPRRGLSVRQVSTADDRRQVALSPERGLCPVGDVDAGEDVREVRLHGALRDPEASARSACSPDLRRRA